MHRFPYIWVILMAAPSLYFYTHHRAEVAHWLSNPDEFFQTLSSGLNHAASSSSATGPALLSEDQNHAVVVIKGDTGEGTGFLVKTANGPAVVTNIHVISANPHLRILTASGAEVKILSVKGATDRDLAMLSIEDDHYSYLDLAANVQETVRSGDAVVTPGNSEGGEVILNTPGKVLGIGPEKIEISNPVYHGNSGGPVIALPGGQVVGVVTSATRMNPADAVDRASYANPDSAIAGPMRYFGLRVDTVADWEPYDMQAFLGETTFLKNFHENSVCLDSYLNGRAYEKMNLTDSGLPDSKYFLRNDTIRALNANYDQMAKNLGTFHRVEVIREWVLAFQNLADSDMVVIQNLGNFYCFDRLRAGEEIAYRRKLQAELALIGDRIGEQTTDEIMRKLAH